MQLGICPYCNLDGLVVTIKATPDGLDVNGKCTACGYTCNSEYASAEIADDLPYEFTRPLDVGAAD